MLLLRFTVFRGAAPDTLFAPGSTYMLGTWLAAMALNWVEGHRLLSYVEEHHSERWKWLTAVSLLGSDFFNTPRFLRWLRSADDSTDPEMARRKTDYRRFLKRALTELFHYIILMPIRLG